MCIYIYRKREREREREMERGEQDLRSGRAKTTNLSLYDLYSLQYC